ncbi:Adenylate kinase 8 [Cichlidogyrus casuarinus]|uniref:Adenylate kinase 8 n=1 Tax=Cichlidogyrus casuarinus TaxID=1844966 RepID=A0ABD2QJ11_9PLAT
MKMATARHQIKNQSILSSPNVIPASVLCEVIKERMDQKDVQLKGFVMSGFPETENQARALNIAGIHPGLVSDSAESITERLVEMPDNDERAIREKINSTNSECQLQQLVYEQCAKVIKVDKPIQDVIEHAITLAGIPEWGIELRVSRVILLGPPGTGIATIAALISKKYKMQDIDVGKAIRAAIERGSKDGLLLKQFVSKNLPIPDLTIAEFVKNLLMTSECARLGWILHGFPKNLAQAEQLAGFNLTPNRVIVLQCSKFTSLERITERRIDKVTGERYNLLTNAPINMEENDNLVQHPSDTEENVNMKLDKYESTKQAIIDYFGDKVEFVDAEKDTHKVFESVDFHVANVRPPKFMSDARKANVNRL